MNTSTRIFLSRAGALLGDDAEQDPRLHTMLAHAAICGFFGGDVPARQLAEQARAAAACSGSATDAGHWGTPGHFSARLHGIR